MRRRTLPIDTLPMWAKVNQVEFRGVSVQAIPSKGHGLAVSAQADEENALLMTVPKDLILTLENVWVLARADKQLHQVLEAMGDYARVNCPACFSHVSPLLPAGTA